MTGELRLVHIGGPTLLIEVDGWRLLVDPTFDPPGRRYGFGFGTSSVKLTGPAIGVDDLPPIDVVLLSHDHHADNLDDAGRRLLPEVPRVVSTRAAARRLRMPNVTGLDPWSTTEICDPDRPTLRVTATRAATDRPGAARSSGTSSASSSSRPPAPARSGSPATPSRSPHWPRCPDASRSTR